jgi:hypothetical protein
MAFPSAIIEMLPPHVHDLRPNLESTSPIFTIENCSSGSLLLNLSRNSLRGKLPSDVLKIGSMVPSRYRPGLAERVTRPALP